MPQSIRAYATLPILAGALAFFIFTAPAMGQRLVADPDDAGQVQRGAAVYGKFCAQCHGARLEGQPNWRQRLPSGRMPAPPHDETGHTWHHPDPMLFDLTKQGVLGFAPAGYESDMPAFGETLSDQQILDALAFIKSRWPPSVRDRHKRLNEAWRKQQEQ
jgi:mono/diheme cytochrome c family protein